jgi:hypothetical protein
VEDGLKVFEDVGGTEKDEQRVGKVEMIATMWRGVE